MTYILKLNLGKKLRHFEISRLTGVHGIISRYGGQITVESKHDDGTAFSILLPKSKGDDLSRIEASTVATPGWGRILFVDDEIALVNLAEQRLRRWGYTVTGMTASTAALDRFRSAPDDYDLIITDHTPPSLTGLELGKAVKRIRSDFPIILCTGYSPDLTEEKAHALGFKAFFFKPVDFIQLNHTIRQVLCGRSQNSF
jgi:CheY-like chemotaxis protein